jgi:hypothetical protein
MSEFGMQEEFNANPFSRVKCGEIAGSATAVQLPNIPAGGLVTLQAASDNAGKVYLGGAGVTIPDGTADSTSGVYLSAGEKMVTNLENLNVLYLICTNAGDDLIYLIIY